MAKNETYDEFVEKFQPKLTTDDCYTPQAIYNTVLEWVRKEYTLPDDTLIMRPFWPGANYETLQYPAGCVIVDNPPFSILTKIAAYYGERGIKYFLFAPGLVTFSGYLKTGACAICANADVEYENSAIVRTSFITNLESGYAVRSAPDLFQQIKKTVEDLRRQKKAELPKYIYPQNVLAASDVNQFSRYGIEFKVRHEDVHFIRALDHQKENKKTIFGAGFLLSEKAAAEKAAAEKAAAEKAAAEKAAAEKAAAEKAAAHIWELSPREKKIIATLGKRKDVQDETVRNDD